MTDAHTSPHHTAPPRGEKSTLTNLKVLCGRNYLKARRRHDVCGCIDGIDDNGDNRRQQESSHEYMYVHMHAYTCVVAVLCNVYFMC